MDYNATKLKWVPASPHIPQAEAAPFYAMTGIVGELDSLNIGVGYTLPFQLLGASWIDADKFADDMNALQLPGLLFRPIHYVPFYGTQKGQALQGVQIYFTDYAKARLCDVQFYALQVLNQRYPSHDILGESGQRTTMFDKVCGSKVIRTRFLQRHNWQDVVGYWEKDIMPFKTLSKKYYLYK